METKEYWAEKCRYIDALLYIRHDTIPKKCLESYIANKSPNVQYVERNLGVKGAMKVSIRNKLQNEKFRKNPFVKFLIKIKRILGVKLY